MIYSIQIRQRIADHAHYMEWRTVPGAFKGRAAVDAYAAYIVRQSHSLDVRAVRRDGSLRHTINYRVGSDHGED